MGVFHPRGDGDGGDDDDISTAQVRKKAIRFPIYAFPCSLDFHFNPCMIFVSIARFRVVFKSAFDIFVMMCLVGSQFSFFSLPDHSLTRRLNRMLYISLA